eukprot:1180408-Prorocentrum_minimum.AAC.1
MYVVSDRLFDAYAESIRPLLSMLAIYSLNADEPCAIREHRRKPERGRGTAGSPRPRPGLRGDFCRARSRAAPTPGSTNQQPPRGSHSLSSRARPISSPPRRQGKPLAQL